MSSLKKIIFIVGPTAVGKSDIAIALAHMISGEIISCDSMQVYQELKVVVDKPKPPALRRIPHHLIDIISVEDSFNVALYNQLVLKVIRTIHAKGRVPIIVGGSMMYVSILLDGIFESTSKDENVRANIKEKMESRGPDFLYKELIKVDPESAKNIHPNDARRLIRALEVFMLEQKPHAQIKKERSGLWGKYDIRIFVINRERSALYERIDRRVDAMFANGLLKEIESLDKFKLSPTVGQSIGIKEVRGYLNGDYDLERAKYLMKLNTRHFAKRQLTWLRKDKRFIWVEIKDNEKPEAVAQKILKGVA